MCFSGPEADGFHPGPAEPAGECHKTDAQSHRYSQPAAERGKILLSLIAIVLPAAYIVMTD